VLALPPGQILLDKVIDPTIHRVTDLGAEAVVLSADSFARNRRSSYVAPGSRPALRQ